MIIEKTDGRESRASSSDKILWLSIIQGYAILLVIGHVGGYNYEGGMDMYTVSTWIQRFCYSYHMPLFMFVSGGLLYLTRLDRGWSTTALYRDKVKRLVCPFVFFAIIGFLIKIPFASVTKSPMDLSVTGFFNSFFDPGSSALKELWFLGTLIWLMALYPLYKTMLKNPWTESILLAVTLIPFVYDMHFTIKGWFHIEGVVYYSAYFVAGILFFKYNITEFFERHLWSVLFSVVIYFAVFLLQEPRLNFVTALMGIVMTFAVGVRIVKLFPGLFGSFRDHSFQIYLVGIFPQMLIELFVWKRFHSEYMLFPYYIISVFMALYTGVLVSKIGRRIPSRLLRWCLGLK